MNPYLTVLESSIETNTWWQLVDLLVALGLSALIGLEREYHQKSAGLRTHTLVGLGTAVFVLVSKYGFADVMYDGITRYDPARVAAQIVSGIGFLGGGLIFVRKDAVRGLTTAATIWVTCAVGMACGAHLYVLALAATIGHFVITFGLVHVARTLPTGSDIATQLALTYEPGHLVLARVLSTCTEHGYIVADVSVDRSSASRLDVLREERLREEDEGFGRATLDNRTRVTLLLRGKLPFSTLIASISDIPGLITVRGGDPDDVAD
ncbi:MgtC/SapB family protein [Nocardioides sp. YIM 152315]|uniref:MgtC/SapB family protein n=1 Tax=Nocardioides sp. YIM 152315 TaxID=3031760 RepID=UPI0023D9D641|nr:MgtC/SapB family protein [Nocardioides sp. YIM 152315]MDF1605467.1 MgtC/SapB family protein [Nocardioides sp. YIM 152315]